MCVPISVSTQKIEGEKFYNEGISLYKSGTVLSAPEGIINLKKAHETFNRALNNKSDIPDFYYMRGITSLEFIHFYFRPFTSEQENMFQGALADFRKTLALDNSFFIAYAGTGNAYDRYGMFDKAIEYYDQAIYHEEEIKEKWGENALSAIYFSKGRSYHRTLKYQCLPNYESALKYNPDSWQVKMHLATAYLQAGRGEEAAFMSDKAVEAIKTKKNKAPWDYRALQTRAKCHAQYGRFDNCIDDLIKALEMAPFTDPDILLALGEAFRDRGDTENGINYFKKTLKCCETLFEHPQQMKPVYTVYNTRGQALMNLHHYPEAIKDFEMTVDLAPEYYPHAHTHYKSDGLKNLALAYSSIGDVSKFEEFLGKTKVMVESQGLEFMLREINGILQIK